MAEARPSATGEDSAPGVRGDGALGYERLRHVNLALFLAFPLGMLFARGVAEVIVAVIGLSFLFVCARSGRWAWLRETPIALAVTLWLFLNLVVSPFAVDPMESFSRSLPWIRFVMFYAAVTVWLLADARDLRLVAWWMAGVVALVSVDVLVQGLSGVALTGNPMFGDGIAGRLTGSLDRPNIGMLLAKFGFPTLGLLAWLCRRASTRWTIPAAAALCALMLAAILLTGERGAAVLTLLGLLLTILFLFVAHPRWRLAAAGLSASLIGTVITVILVVERLRARGAVLADDLSRFPETIYGNLFDLSLRIFLDNPLSGVGLKNFRLVCPLYKDAGVLSECHPHAHNIYLEWLSEAGAVGFLLFVAFVVSLFVAMARLARRNAGDAVSMGLLFGALVLSLFPLTASQSFFSNWPAMLLWFSIALAMATARGPWRGGRSGGIPE